MQRLQKQIGYQFRDLSLLKTALTHSSFTNEHPGDEGVCYERLEFLGDSILGLVTAEYLYNVQPPLPEGKMTKIRADLVCEESLFQVAQELNLGELMRLGRGEERTDGRKRPSILADMVESLIAALFIDGGIETARLFIQRFVLQNAMSVILQRSRDNKTELQELVQRKQGSVLQYELLREAGPDHAKQFTFSVLINGRQAGVGSGRSKKEAEQAAAGAALENMKH